MNSDYWFQRNVFVTGASGFLGFWICEKLVELKANVVALVRDQIPNSLLDKEGIQICRVNGCLEDYCPVPTRSLSHLKDKISVGSF